MVAKDDSEVTGRPQVIARHPGNRTGRTEFVMPFEQVGSGHRKE